MSNLLQRSITGTIIVVVLISCISLGKYYVIPLFTIVTILGLKEFYSLSESKDIQPQKITGSIAGIIIFMLITLFIHQIVGIKELIIILPIAFLLFCVELFRRKDNPLQNISFTILGILYFAIPMALLNSLAYPPHINDNALSEYNPNILLGFFYLMWTNDTGAYFFGSKLGKHKLYERISPQKTWEGTIGGAISCMLAAYCISIYYTELSLFEWLTMGAITSTMGTLGDLIQSMFKRSTNIKDSGTILPGHGGILDRFDGVLISIPFVFIYLQLLKL